MSATIDFLCIGAPRAGTTWLWNVLRQHPGIWMPPIKELHYFDRSLKYPSPSLFADDLFLDRLLGRERHHALFRTLLLRSMVKHILLPQNWGNLPWILRYLMGTPGDAWYLSLFDSKKKAVKGEITPAYSILTEKDVRHVHALLPNLKVIYLIRNPVDRAWSDMRLRKAKRTLDLDDLDDVIRTIDSPSQVNRCDYFRTITLWSSIFPKEQLLVCFFDEIVHHPQQLVKKILTYLKVDDSFPVSQAKLTDKVNAAEEKPIPDSIKRYLAQKYYPEVKKLIPLVGGYSQEWMKMIEAIL